MPIGQGFRAACLGLNSPRTHVNPKCEQAQSRVHWGKKQNEAVGQMCLSQKQVRTNRNSIFCNLPVIHHPFVIFNDPSLKHRGSLGLAIYYFWDSDPSPM